MILQNIGKCILFMLAIDEKCQRDIDRERN